MPLEWKDRTALIIGSDVQFDRPVLVGYGAIDDLHAFFPGHSRPKHAANRRIGLHEYDVIFEAQRAVGLKFLAVMCPDMKDAARDDPVFGTERFHFEQRHA